jgi:hypothetical protein
MSAAAPERAWIIRKVQWWNNGHFFERVSDGASLCAYRDRAGAEKQRRRLERRARAAASPFAYGDYIEEIYALEDGKIERRLKALGIGFPQEWEDQAWAREDWIAWWEGNAPGWSAQQREDAWDVFEGLRFYEIAEVEVEASGEPAGKLFVVQRVEGHIGGCYRDWLRDAHGEIMRAFPRRDQAEAFIEEWERRERPAINPFQFEGGLDDYTSMEPELFCDWLRDFGLEPLLFKVNGRTTAAPAAGPWRDWWDRVAPGLSEAQRRHVWAGLDRARLLKVVEVALRG